MKHKLKIFKILIITFICIVFSKTLSFADEPIIYSEAAILIDSNNGNIIYEKNSNKLMYPASTTKILTAIITLESCKLNEKVTSGYDAVTSIKSGYTNAKIQVRRNSYNRRFIIRIIAKICK